MGLKQYIKRGVDYVLHGIPVQNTIANISYLSASQKLAGRKIIITGGGRGLGASMAKKFVEEGADVIIAGRGIESLQKLSADLGCKYIQLDVSDTMSFKSFIEQSNTLLGGVDTLVNNAGISLHEDSFFDVTPETFNSQIATNLAGGYFLTQEFISLLCKEGRCGNILFTSSETGETADFRPYGLTKAAINSLVQGLAYLFAKDGFRINAIAPGITASDMTGLKSEGNIYYKWNINNRVYMPDEVAETACFLLSDASGCISGQIITCNNGKSINARWK